MSQIATEERGSSSTSRWRQEEDRDAAPPTCESAESTPSSDGQDRRPSPKLLSLPVIRGCECGVVAGVQKRWASSGYTALRHIACGCNDGVSDIGGTVPSYFLKQMAQELARNVDGVHRIENRLNVTDKALTSSVKSK